MAKKTVSRHTTPSDEQTVMAIGDSGEFEPTPMSEVVEIQTAPVAEGSYVVPATLRWLAREPGQFAPIQLLKIEKPSARKDRPFARVTWRCAPFVRYTLGKEKIMGEEQSCFVRNEADAYDPLFQSLSINERMRILRAARTTR
jgi:hypothetical protein